MLVAAEEVVDEAIFEVLVVEVGPGDLLVLVVGGAKGLVGGDASD